MKKAFIKPAIMVAFLAAVMGVSSAPLSASAMDGRDWNNNSWSRNDRRYMNNYNRWGNNYIMEQHRYCISDWEARSIAQNNFPGRWIVSDNQWWDRDGRLERQFRFNDNNVIVIRDDGAIIIIT